MKISGISSPPTAKSAATKPVDPYQKQIEALMNQKSQIVDNIASVKSNEKLSIEQKNDRISMLTTQMQSIETQIMQKRMEQAEKEKEKKEKAGGKTDNKDTREMDKAAGKQEQGSIDRLLSSDVQHENLAMMQSVRRKLQSESGDLKSEVKMNRMHLMGGPSHISRSEMRINAELTVNKSKLEQSQSIEERIARLDLRIGENIASDKAPSIHKPAEITTEEKKADNAAASKNEENTDGSRQSLDIRV